MNTQGTSKRKEIYLYLINIIVSVQLYTPSTFLSRKITEKKNLSLSSVKFNGHTVNKNNYSVAVLCAKNASQRKHLIFRFLKPTQSSQSKENV